ncbi:MAG TPA: AAC(3) family N-acetyltransferase [Gemmatimonadales bacterium]|nr:AAC(3) family N-acetyltransferase [Gemmatimonadales bacterium]
MLLQAGRWVKRQVRGRLRIALTSWGRPYASADLLTAVRELGVVPGDTLLVHSSFDKFGKFTGKPSDVLTVLQAAVGPSGTLMLPTLPFTGMSTVEYAREPRVFDVKRTPSQMGLLTELFRRAPGVVRSVHPTHPVAIWGADATELAAGHAAAKTPCGVGSPYAKLLDRDGKIMFLGCNVDVMTFIHTVEEVLEPRMPFSPFTTRTYVLESRDAVGQRWVTETRLSEPRYARRRRLAKLVPVLRRRGAWREGRVGGLRMRLVAARQVLDTCQALADRGIYCYDT